MEEKPPAKGFFAGLFGLGKAGSEANQSKKKGRKEHYAGLDGLKKLIECIERRGEASPSELAQELGVSRSTLTYNLNRLLNHPTLIKTSWRYESNAIGRSIEFYLGSKRLERLGTGQKIRYRIVESPQQGQEGSQ